MGNIAAHPQFYLNDSWCNTKCRLDTPFKIPYSRSEDLILQLDISRFANLKVCAVYGIDLNGVRLTANLKDSLGPAYWKQNTNTTGMNIFTIRVPDIGACVSREVADPNCCYIDIYEVGDPHSGAYSVFSIIYNGTAYDLLADTLPPGWHFVNITQNKRYVYFPCNEVGDTVQISAQLVSDDTFFAFLPKKQCPEEFCDCYYLIPEDFYASINRVIIHGNVYTHDSVLVQSPSLIPGISPNTQHVPPSTTPGYWKVFIDCNIDPKFVDFQTDISGTWASVNATYGKACEEHTITRTLNCFAFEFIISSGHGCEDDPAHLSIFSEPYQCTDANCEYNEATAVIYSSYAGKAHDTLGIWTFNIGDIGDVAMNDGALGNFAAPGLRIPAIVLDLPTRIAVTRNSKCYIYKSEAIYRYKLQGRRAFPPYFAKMVESIALGRSFNYDGKLYQIVGEAIFEPIDIPGISAFKLNTQLEGCSQNSYFDC